MIDLKTAEQALKSVYLGVVSEQLNLGVNPFLSKIEKTSRDVYGKDIVKAVTYGLNGGIGAGSETGVLPRANGNNYANFKTELKNLYGTIEISDKALRASQNSAGAFVNLLNAEMEGLLSASKFNLARMLHGDGSGKVSQIVEDATNSDASIIACKSVRGLSDGMILDFYAQDGAPIAGMTGRKILWVDRNKNTFKVDGGNATTVATTSYFTVQGSKDNEITGLKGIFDNDVLYGLKRAEHKWLAANSTSCNGSLTFEDIQSNLDKIDDNSGYQPDFMLAGTAAKKAYQKLLMENRTNVDSIMLEGYRCLSFEGIPMYVDRFAEADQIFALHTEDFKLYQLCDWRWLEGENGNILRQNSNTATYTGTLVKYAELLCERPCAQGRISNII